MLKLRFNHRLTRLTKLIVKLRLKLGLFKPVDVTINGHRINPYGLPGVGSWDTGEVIVIFGKGKLTAYYVEWVVEPNNALLDLLCSDDVHECFVGDALPSLTVSPRCQTPIEEIIDTWLASHHLKKGTVTDLRLVAA